MTFANIGALLGIFLVVLGIVLANVRGNAEELGSFRYFLVSALGVAVLILSLAAAHVHVSWT